jgi:hypothetical protein
MLFIGAHVRRAPVVTVNLNECVGRALGFFPTGGIEHRAHVRLQIGH